MIGDVPIFGIDPRLPDIGRVEVLKGPQGTLYGASAMGGLIKFIPNVADSRSFSAKITAKAGFVTDGGEDYDLTGVVNLPLAEDVLAVRIVGYHIRESGFIDLRIKSLTEIGTPSTTPQLGLLNGVISPEMDPRSCSSQSSGNTCFKDVNVTTVSGVRATATFTPTDNIEIQPIIMRQRRTLANNNNVDGNEPIFKRYTERYTKTPSYEKFWFGALNAKVTFGAVEFLYAGGYVERDYESISDFTLPTFNTKNAFPVISGAPPLTVIPSPITLDYANQAETTTHELRAQLTGYNLGGLLGNDTTLDVTAGYFNARDKRKTTVTSREPLWNQRADAAHQIRADGCNYCTEDDILYKNNSLFLDATINLPWGISLGAGIRYFDQSQRGRFRSVIDTGVPGTREVPVNSGTYPTVQADGTTKRFGAAWKMNKDNLLFYNYGEGFRLGNSQDVRSFQQTARPICKAIAAELGVDKPVIDSDEVKTHELGLKSSFFGSRLTINPALFFTKWSKIQQSVVFSNINPDCHGFVLNGNVGEAEVKGVDLEISARPFDRLTLTLAGSHIDASVSAAPAGASIKKGDNIAGVPEWMGSASFEYGFPLPSLGGRGYIRADWRYVSSRQLNFGSRATQNPLTIAGDYDIGNARIGLSSGSWDASIFVDNITDTEACYACRISTGVFWQQDKSVNRPRTFGFSVSREF